MIMVNESHLEKRIFELHAEICKTLSHPKRLEIIDVLRDGKEMGVSEMAEKLGITKANASQHLSVMRQQNMVKTRRDGVAILYSLSNPKILVAYDALRKALKEQLKADGKLLEKF
jgi:ArsR family transcriptional regulator